MQWTTSRLEMASSLAVFSDLNDMSVTEQATEGADCTTASRVQEIKSIIKGGMYFRCGFTEHKFQCLTPAGTNEHPLAGGRVGDGAIVMDEGRVECHAVHVKGH